MQSEVRLPLLTLLLSLSIIAHVLLHPYSETRWNLLEGYTLGILCTTLYLLPMFQYTSNNRAAYLTVTILLAIAHISVLVVIGWVIVRSAMEWALIKASAKIPSLLDSKFYIFIHHNAGGPPVVLEAQRKKESLMHNVKKFSFAPARKFFGLQDKDAPTANTNSIIPTTVTKTERRQFVLPPAGRSILRKERRLNREGNRVAQYDEEERNYNLHMDLEFDPDEVPHQRTSADRGSKAATEEDDSSLSADGHHENPWKSGTSSYRDTTTATTKPKGDTSTMWDTTDDLQQSAPSNPNTTHNSRTHTNTNTYTHTHSAGDITTVTSLSRASSTDGQDMTVLQLYKLKHAKYYNGEQPEDDVIRLDFPDICPSEMDILVYNGGGGKTFADPVTCAIVLSVLKKCNNLHTLDLSCTDMPDDHCIKLCRVIHHCLPKLNLLSLHNNSELTDKCATFLAHLAKTHPRLMTIQTSNTNISARFSTAINKRLNHKAMSQEVDLIPTSTSLSSFLKKTSASILNNPTMGGAMATSTSGSAVPTSASKRHSMLLNDSFASNFKEQWMNMSLNDIDNVGSTASESNGKLTPRPCSTANNSVHEMSPRSSIGERVLSSAAIHRTPTSLSMTHLKRHDELMSNTDGAASHLDSFLCETTPRIDKIQAATQQQRRGSVRHQRKHGRSLPPSQTAPRAKGQRGQSLPPATGAPRKAFLNNDSDAVTSSAVASQSGNSTSNQLLQKNRPPPLGLPSKTKAGLPTPNMMHPASASMSTPSKGSGRAMSKSSPHKPQPGPRLPSAPSPTLRETAELNPHGVNRDD